MSFLSTLNISASGMTAQRLRLDIAAENITNINTTRTDEGGAYRRKTVVLEANDSSFDAALRTAMNYQNTAGVTATAIEEDDSQLPTVYDPDHPDADENGYVEMPNVDLVKETTDAMAATRAYEANITAFNAATQMAQKALEIGR